MLESLKNELLSLFEEQGENSNQVLDNFVELQKRFLTVYQDLDRLKNDQDKRFAEFLDQQRITFEESTTRLKVQYNDLSEKHDLTASERIDTTF